MAMLWHAKLALLIQMVVRLEGFRHKLSLLESVMLKLLGAEHFSLMAH
jgi:hypothetical protein